MKFKKLMGMCLSATLMASLLTGCGSSSDSSTATTNPDGTPAPTTITWYYPLDNSVHHDKAWAAVNEYLEEKINVVVDYKPISWGEYDTKTNAIKTSGQSFDIMLEMGKYAQSVDLGVAQPIEQYLDTAGLDMKNTLPETLWDSVTIDGHIYGIPTYKDNATIFGFVYNKTMAEEIGMEIPDFLPLSMDVIDDFYREAYDKMEKTYGADHGIVATSGMAMIDVFEQHATRGAVSKIEGGYMFQDKGDGEVFDIYSQQEVVEYYEVIRSWVEDGILPFDSFNLEKDPLKSEGKLFTEIVQGYVDFPADGWSKDYETGFIATDPVYMTTGGASFGTNIVGSNSKNPEAAVAFLNLMNTDSFVANTLRFGVEGEYQNVTADNRLDFTGTLNEDPSARAYYNWYGWQFGNIFAMSLPAQENDSLFENIMAANESAAVGAHLGFTADTSKIQNEITACEAVYIEYRDNLDQGMLKDVAGSLAEMNKKMESAGINKIVEEIQGQVNAWRVENGLPAFN